MYYTRAEIDSTPDLTPISSITDNSIGAKKVTLNLSDIQIYDENGSSRYLTPVKVPTPVLITTKTYDLPTLQKPKLISYKKRNFELSHKKSLNQQLDFDKIEIDLSNNDIEKEILKQCETIRQSMKDLISQDDIQSNEEIEKKRIISTDNSKNLTHECDYESHDDNIQKPINEKFVVNLFESRPSKRWRKCKRNLQMEHLDKNVRNIDDILHISDLNRTNQVKMQNSEVNVQHVPLEKFDNGLLKVVSNSVIYDMINDIQQSIKPPNVIEASLNATNFETKESEKNRNVSF